MNNLTIYIELSPTSPAEGEMIRNEIMAAIENEIDIEFLDDNAKENSKGLSLDWNPIIIGLAASGGVLTTLIGLLQKKIENTNQITIEIDGDKLTLTNPTTEQQELLLRHWTNRHSDKQKPHKLMG